MIVIIDYRVGNVGSIQNMLRRLGHESSISSSKEEISRADKLILPGVGAFDAAMNKLNDSELTGIINERVLVDKVPVLGICLGMQLMTKGSAEGVIPGLGWIDATCKKFDFSGIAKDQQLKIPHMGWGATDIVSSGGIFADWEGAARFYYVHSYYVALNNPEDAASTCEYGIKFTSSFRKQNIFGVQFHPEKSHKFGMRLLNNFASMIND